MQLQEAWEKEHQELLLLRDQLSGPQGFYWGKQLQLHDLEAKIDRLQGEEEDLGSRQRQDEKRLTQKDTQDQSTSMLFNTNERLGRIVIHPQIVFPHNATSSDTRASLSDHFFFASIINLLFSASLPFISLIYCRTKSYTYTDASLLTNEIHSE